MQVQSLGGEDALEEGMATHASILVWGIPWTEELVSKDQTQLSTHIRKRPLNLFFYF